MDRYEIIETKERIEADNDIQAEKVCEQLKARKVFMVNLMSSPGAGKTTVLVRTIKALQKKYRIGVMEADVDSDVDAKTIADTGTRVIQLHTGGSCHMDADMTRRGLEEMGIDDLDIIFLENVGNLVCPAEFDVGAAKKVMILSVPEGDDKPLKYPLIFQVSDVMLENKIDTVSIFDYDPALAEERAKQLNPDIQTFRISALNGDGFEAWTDWLINAVEEWRKSL